jgi:hypothetical protein
LKDEIAAIPSTPPIARGNTRIVVTDSLTSAFNEFKSALLEGRTNLIADLISRSPAPSPIAAIQATYGPTTLSDVINSCHNGLVGHGGIEATVQKLEAAGHHWANMQKDVEEYVRGCGICQKSAPIPSTSLSTAPYHTYATTPFAHLQIDHAGPYPEDDRGAKYILVVVDRCTRFTFLFATKTKDARETAIALLQVIGLMGNPATISSDQGGAFVSDVIADLLVLLGVHHNLNIAHDHQSNGLVERPIREVNRHLTNLTMEARIAGTWSTFLPLIGRIINSTKNRTTGFAPTVLVLGKYAQPSPNVVPFPAALPYTDLAKDLMKAQEISLSSAMHNQDAFTEKVERSRPVATSTFHPGDLCLMQHSEETRPNKLSPRWRGPFRVKSIQGAYLQLASPLDDSITTTHASNCKPFILSAGTDTAALASCDIDEYFVESIIDNKPNPLTGAKKNWSFLVRWKGFSSAFDEWLNYFDVRHTEAFKAWMTQHKH